MFLGTNAKLSSVVCYTPINVRPYGGADGSDHNLIMAKLCLKEDPQQNESPNPFFYSEKLQEKTLKRAFTMELPIRFGAPSVPEEAECETVWEAMKGFYQEIAKSTLGASRSSKPQWLSEKKWQLIEERKKTIVSVL
ncbi:hypothetical protein QYM36_016926 [Artemia franciscana]|uniref:Uncharacterized protein n=1 Tax=Artemia franciscana TaxID=6661 RepID=A0AA88HC11_ARTSF|nr:hypothetical protein QYM36_016926 [Artemia franciscana]